MTSGEAASGLRRAHAGDLRALVALDRELFGPDAWGEPGWRDELSRPNPGSPNPGRVVVLEADWALAGYGVVVLGPETAEVFRVAVAPAYRRRGSGRALLSALVDRARRAGCEAVLLEVAAANAAALRLYTSAGFTETGRRPGYFDRGRVTAVTMRLELSAPATAAATAPATAGHGDRHGDSHGRALQ